MARSTKRSTKPSAKYIENLEAKLAAIKAAFGPRSLMADKCEKLVHNLTRQSYWRNNDGLYVHADVFDAAPYRHKDKKEELIDVAVQHQLIQRLSDGDYYLVAYLDYNWNFCSREAFRLERNAKKLAQKRERMAKKSSRVETSWEDRVQQKQVVTAAIPHKNYKESEANPPAVHAGSWTLDAPVSCPIESATSTPDHALGLLGSPRVTGNTIAGCESKQDDGSSTLTSSQSTIMLDPPVATADPSSSSDNQSDQDFFKDFPSRMAAIQLKHQQEEELLKNQPNVSMSPITQECLETVTDHEHKEKLKVTVKRAHKPLQSFKAAQQQEPIRVHENINEHHVVEVLKQAYNCKAYEIDESQKREFIKKLRSFNASHLDLGDALYTGLLKVKKGEVVYNWMSYLLAGAKDKNCQRNNVPYLKDAPKMKNLSVHNGPLPVKFQKLLNSIVGPEPNKSSKFEKTLTAVSFKDIPH